ncbi:glycosyltransferase family protein [Vibrio diabolicus]|uniref:glycosyltransferase family 2 protein n=1 Tax=Vibrio diabolicus TaxID=50719 RepID=UPI003751770F
MSLLSEDFQVIVKSNKVGDDFTDLLNAKGFHWINKNYGCGFGHNNNIVFDFCRSNLGMKENDYFIVLNPDVVISNSVLNNLVHEMKDAGVCISAINLFKNLKDNMYDNSIRNFPTLVQFIKSFLGFGNTSIIDKSKIDNVCNVDWAAGSFLAFKAGHYELLRGFDERYFMYCEDIDICYRSHLIGHRLTYFPNIMALHLAKHENRNLFSKHFFWHLTSAMRFLLSKKIAKNTKSIL